MHILYSRMFLQLGFVHKKTIVQIPIRKEIYCVYGSWFVPGSLEKIGKKMPSFIKGIVSRKFAMLLLVSLES
jgi:UDP-2,3-diacylglucosamine pyrophosphatase LpxH